MTHSPFDIFRSLRAKPCVRVRLGLVVVTLGLVSLCLLSEHIHAAEVPKTTESLFGEADVVVIAEVTDLNVRKERSRIEKGFGNYDWDITCTLRIDAVEKGDVAPGNNINARCFAVYSRKSAMESISLQGHLPIPERGQTVRVYLRQENSEFSVLHPNGFAAAKGSAIMEAESINDQGYTFLLPLELWVVVLAVGFIVWTARRLISKLRGRRQNSNPVTSAVGVNT